MRPDGTAAAASSAARPTGGRQLHARRAAAALGGQRLYKGGGGRRAVSGHLPARGGATQSLHVCTGHHPYNPVPAACKPAVTYPYFPASIAAAMATMLILAVAAVAAVTATAVGTASAAAAVAADSLAVYIDGRSAPLAATPPPRAGRPAAEPRTYTPPRRAPG